ncbi:MAG TPA: hypothetical protein PLE99_03020 [Candidatus Thiothrix moscowensis]|uniref:hypothetical protein n=1 Tax=unclassified Thiothrix TaxID=2636184 RepID=UPI001A30E381|nr:MULTISPECIES: hypothetical protein [unclassified Thiothrix]MBJ6609317.1 hypothetical protein [Candidatus Thiothrix moscowensis]HRJ51714.1 hypothetical protein [Candidatus Thiothrix moscowensis]HRJ92029.1 hypothetical protein [Candidatus Thiothrix moscowensis]
MHGMVPPDPDGGVSRPIFATVYLPKFKPGRNRFPASCIQPYADADAAVAAAKCDAKRFPAIVLGPSKSSEGQYLYYLVEWLA